MIKSAALIAAGMLCALSVAGQDSSSHAAIMAKHWKTSKTFTLAVADAMPAADYNFKPSAEEMSFGDLMVHIALANASYVSRAAGETSPFKKPEKVDKETAVKLLTETFDYCITKVSGFTGEQFGRMVGPEGRQMFASEAVWSGFTHTAHHRGQAEVYLRVKGIKPPAYAF